MPRLDTIDLDCTAEEVLQSVIAQNPFEQDGETWLVRKFECENADEVVFRMSTPAHAFATCGFEMRLVRYEAQETVERTLTGHVLGGSLVATHEETSRNPHF